MKRGPKTFETIGDEREMNEKESVQRDCRSAIIPNIRIFVGVILIGSRGP
jgi:hypothetical protein